MAGTCTHCASAPAIARELCQQCYNRWYQTGAADTPRVRQPQGKCANHPDKKAKARDLCSPCYAKWRLGEIAAADGTWNEPAVCTHCKESPELSGGLCRACYQRRQPDGTVRDRKTHKRKGVRCPVIRADGQQCPKNVERQGMCPGHARRQKLYGDPLGQPAPKQAVYCAVEEDTVACGREADGAHGMCDMHYKRQWRHGTPTPALEDHPSFRRADLIKHQATQEELAWAAGFLEGDGCFTATVSSGHGAPPRAVICAAQIKTEPLERLQAILGGGITQLQRLTTTGNTVWVWNLASAVALRRVVPRLVPHLTFKRRQAELVLAIAAATRARGSGLAVTTEEIALRKEAAGELRVRDRVPLWKASGSRAWAAGIIASEGYLTVRRNGQATLTVAMTSCMALHILARWYGGAVTGPYATGDRHTPIYQWSAPKVALQGLLTDLEGLLHGKEHERRLLLEAISSSAPRMVADVIVAMGRRVKPVELSASIAYEALELFASA